MIVCWQVKITKLICYDNGSVCNISVRQEYKFKRINEKFIVDGLYEPHLVCNGLMPKSHCQSCHKQFNIEWE